MTRRYHANNFTTTLTTTISDSSTTIVIASASGLPTISANETYRLTISQVNRREIVIVTARSGTSLTVTRAAEGTTAQAFTTGATIQLRSTADSYDRKQDTIATAGDNIDFGAAATFEVPNSTAPTFNATGQLALDTDVTNYSDGLLCYRAGSTTYGIVALDLADLASPTDTYGVTYDAATDKFKLSATGGGGSVIGPGSSTDNAIVKFDGTTGDLVQNSGVSIDDDNNIVSNNTFKGYSTTVKSGTSVTMTISSPYTLFFTGTASQIINLPNTTTLTLGAAYRLYNNGSAGDLTVRAAGSNILTVAPYHSVVCTTINISSNSSSSWECSLLPPFRTSLINSLTTNATLLAADRILLQNSSSQQFYTSCRTILGAAIEDAGALAIASNDLIPFGDVSAANVARTTTPSLLLQLTPPGSVVSGTTQTCAVNNSYIANNASAVTFTLPSVAAVNDVVSISGNGAGGWVLTAASGDTIKGLGNTTTSGGTITPANQYDSITVRCVVANTTWVVVSYCSTLLTFA